MAIRHALLGLLATEPKHGYELKAAFKEALAGTWEVNPGQIYTTLSRLLRDGLVTNQRVEQDDRPDKKVYTLTDEGRKELARWFETPIGEEQYPRDELLVKLLVFRQVGGGDGRHLVWRQRKAHLETMRQLVKLSGGAGEAVAQLLFERAILHLEADLRWLERCENELFKMPEEGVKTS